MEAENAQLKREVGRMQHLASNESHDKQKYMEGAVWMGKRMSGEVERVCKVFETLMEDYKKRFSDFERAYHHEEERAVRLSQQNMNGRDDRVVMDHMNVDKKQREMELLQLQRAQVWFLEAIQQTTVDMYERIVVMLESALFHQHEASSLIQDAYTPVRKIGDTMDEAAIASSDDQTSHHNALANDFQNNVDRIGSYIVGENTQYTGDMSSIPVQQSQHIQAINIGGISTSMTPQKVFISDQKKEQQSQNNKFIKGSLLAPEANNLSKEMVRNSSRQSLRQQHTN